MRRPAIRILLIGGAVLLLLLQLFQPDRTNPPVVASEDAREHLTMSPRVSALLRDACYDCHSHETRWPWYSYVAPVSWLVSRDVTGGRRELNFSRWSTYDARTQIGRMGAVADEVAEGAMPLPIYIAMHDGADLSGEERDSLVAWAEAMRERLIEQERARRDTSAE